MIESPRMWSLTQSLSLLKPPETLDLVFLEIIFQDIMQISNH